MRQVRSEGSKVVWPSWNDTLRTAIMVLIMTALLAVFFFAVDSFFSTVVRWLLSLIG
jgi:preprotein translocase subunit SecE